MLGKMVWTFSVHTAMDVKKGSVFNVVCYERVCFEQVCYEWICYEWSVMNGSVLNGNNFVALLCFYESRVSNCLL